MTQVTRVLRLVAPGWPGLARYPGGGAGAGAGAQLSPGQRGRGGGRAGAQGAHFCLQWTAGTGPTASPSSTMAGRGLQRSSLMTSCRPSKTTPLSPPGWRLVSWWFTFKGKAAGVGWTDTDILPTPLHTPHRHTHTHTHSHTPHIPDTPHIDTHTHTHTPHPPDTPYRQQTYSRHTHAHAHIYTTHLSPNTPTHTHTHTHTEDTPFPQHTPPSHPLSSILTKGTADSLG